MVTDKLKAPTPIAKKTKATKKPKPSYVLAKTNIQIPHRDANKAVTFENRMSLVYGPLALYQDPEKKTFTLVLSATGMLLAEHIRSSYKATLAMKAVVNSMPSERLMLLFSGTPATSEEILPLLRKNLHWILLLKELILLYQDLDPKLQRILGEMNPQSKQIHALMRRISSGKMPDNFSPPKYARRFVSDLFGAGAAETPPDPVTF